MPAKQGALYVKWGSKMDELLHRSILSLRTHHPDLPVHIHELPANSTLLAKANLFEYSPFDTTLFLDADTVVLAPLQYGFLQAERHGLACCVNENPYARRYAGLKDHVDLVEYNTGVLFFTRAAAPIFQRWPKFAREINSRMDFVSGGTTYQQVCNDQAAFARAVDEAAVATGRAPFVLPQNWNFRPRWQRTFFGELKIWHDDLPPGEVIARWCVQQAKPGTITEFANLADDVPSGNRAPAAS